MNTRLQVEHPITEMVTGVDLVQWQIRIARGERLDARSGARCVTPNGPRASSAGSTRRIPTTTFCRRRAASSSCARRRGPGIRDDSGATAGLDVPIFYDPMISKLVAWAEDRPRAIARMRRALAEYLVTGIKTTVPFFTWLLDAAGVRRGPVPHHVSRRGAEGAQRPAVRRADARGRGHRRDRGGAAGAAVARTVVAPNRGRRPPRPPRGNGRRRPAPRVCELEKCRIRA